MRLAWVFLVACASVRPTPPQVPESTHEDGNDGIAEADPLPPEPVPSPPPLPALPPLERRVERPQLALGAQHSCLLAADGQVRCWGSNRFGQLGTGAATGYPEYGRTPSDPFGDYVQIESGAQHVCALTEEGEVDCWGHGGYGQLANASADGYGQLANASADDSPRPMRLPFSDVVQLSAGDGFTCALSSDRSVRCVGRNDMGQLGNGSRQASAEPTAVQSLSAIAIGSGRAHSCALSVDGRLLCWGENLDGQLGNGAQSDAEATPVQIDLAVVRLLARDLVATGRALSRAVLAAPEPATGAEGAPSGAPDGDVAESGESNESNEGPQRASFALALGGGHTCALIAGEARCWGRNDSHQLGRGADAPAGGAMSVAPTPGLVGPADEAALGSRFSCLRREGEVLCVGLGRDGQLGDGTRRMRRVWTPVRGLRGALQIAAGLQHACATTARGVECWGDNRRGEVGDGTVENRPVPTRVRGITRAMLVAP